MVNVANAGSQFRSRDYYPDAVVGIAYGEKRFIGEDIPVAEIPDAPENRIGFIDGYGNLKTTLRHRRCRIPVGTKVRVSVNTVVHEGVVADETYKVKDGDVSFAPGSTGGDDRFMEIWVRGDSAWRAFVKPRVEQEFTVEPVK